MVSEGAHSLVNGRRIRRGPTGLFFMFRQWPCSSDSPYLLVLRMLRDKGRNREMRLFVCCGLEQQVNVKIVDSCQHVSDASSLITCLTGCY